MAGYIFVVYPKDLSLLCNPAIATPGLTFITAADLEKYWRSNFYSHLAKKVMSRPAIAFDTAAED